MTDQPHSESVPNLLQAPWLHQSYLLGHPAEQHGHYQEALAIYQRVLELDRTNILAHLLQARALLNLEREHEAKRVLTTALHFAEHTLDLHPESARAWTSKADALWMLSERDQDRTNEALYAYGQALTFAPNDPEASVNRGWLHLVLGRFQEALHDFEQAQRAKPDDPHIQYCKGCVLWETWQYEEALQAHEQAIALDPMFARAYLAKSTTLSSLDRGAEARQAFAFYRQLVGANE